MNENIIKLENLKKSYFLENWLEIPVLNWIDLEIKKNENIIKYGVPIGHALEDIKIGEHVHTHNIKTNLKDLLNYSYDKKIEDFKVSLPNKNVNVYQRKNGDVGIRNELWIVPTVGCVNGIGEQIKERFEKEYDISNIEEMEKVLQKIKIYVTFTPYLKNIPLSIDNTTLLTLWDFLCPAIIRLLKNLIPTPAHTDVYADKPYIQALTAT